MNYKEVNKMCRICLGIGSRNLFYEQSLGSSFAAREDLGRIAEKLRFVTMLKVNPKENLPHQICDLCIVQLNVSYNFKRLALKNDFQIRQYMIENGMNLMKEDDDSNMEMTTALEIHQIQHNVIRTNRFRQLAAPEIRRNSTTSSGASTMLMHGKDNELTASTTSNTIVNPRPVVKPIQVKLEPFDEDEQHKEPSPLTSSPSSASEPSIITISSNSLSTKRSPTIPMVQINGIINNDSFGEKSDNLIAPAPLSVKQGRSHREIRSREETHTLRTITRNRVMRKSKRKVEKVLIDISKRASTRKISNKIVQNNKAQHPRPRGRPPKDPNAPKMTYKTKRKIAKS